MQELTFNQIENVSGGDWADVASSAIGGGAAGAAVVGANSALAAIGTVAAFSNPVSLGIIGMGLAVGAIYGLFEV